MIIDFVPGDTTGLDIPAHPEAMRERGVRFLTDAFRAYGSLGPDNSVTRITHFEAFAGGNSGQKVIFSVEYAREDHDLPTDLFAKFSRDFTDVFRDRRKFELEAETRLASLSRLPDFPVSVARPCFADFHHASGTGLLITERIAFGRNGIEPLHRKCMDHELADPLEYYEATVTALARLAAAHESGRLSPQLEELFPYDAETAAADLPIPWSETELREKVAAFGQFACDFPRLLPASIATPQFVGRLERDAVRFLRHEARIKHFLHADPDFIALCHWNTNIDNAWFWRDSAGKLQCGLLDWGMVRQMNLGYGLWGGLSAATGTMLDAHLDALLALFIVELHRGGGPKLTEGALKLHFDLSVAALCLGLMMDAPALVRSRLPEAAEASGPLDPIVRQDTVVQGFLHVFTNALNLWERRDFGASLSKVLG